jgi:hypothetical protein
VSAAEAESEECCWPGYLADVLKRVDAWQPVFVRDEHLVQNYVTVLNHPEANFVLDLCSFQARSSFPHNEPGGSEKTKATQNSSVETDFITRV